MLLLLRVVAALAGAVWLCKITAALLDGHITYTLGEVTEEQVTTKTLPEACAIWLAFSALFVGLIIGGAAPRWYVEKPWLSTVLLCTIFVGYVLGSLLR